MDDLQAQRIARNEARFRDLNERTVAATDELHGERQAECTVVCECALADCDAMITVPVKAYEAARAASERFLVLPDHVIVSAERAIEHGDGYWIVEKIGAGAIVAKQLDQ